MSTFLLSIVFCKASESCNGKGECNSDDGTCQCYDDFLGANCSGTYDLHYMM